MTSVSTSLWPVIQPFVVFFGKKLTAIDGAKQVPVVCDITGIQVGTRRRPGTPGSDVCAMNVVGVRIGKIVVILGGPDSGGE
jgi:hypothetical protein